MIIYDPIITGSFQINGSTISSVESIDAVSQSVADLKSDSGSFSSRVSLVETSTNSLNQASSSYAFKTDISGSFTSVSSSLASRIASNEGSVNSLNSASSSYLLNTTDTLVGDLTVTGTITAQEFHTEFVSASILYDSGSTKFGNSADDTHTFTGTGSFDILGIGTTAPLSPIHQVGGGVNYTGQIRVGGSSTAFGLVLDYNQASATSATIYTSPSYNSADILFKLGAGLGNTDQLVLRGNGKIGIGTTAPAAKLHINTLTGDGLLITTNDVTTIKMGSTTGGTTWWGFATTNLAANDFGIYQSNSGGGDPVSAGTPRLYFKGNGDVGIGTTSPSQKLHVVGQAIIDGGVGVASSGTFHVRQKGDTNADGIALTSSSSTSHRIWKDSNGKLNIGPTSLSSAFVQDLSGNVGIGTTSPNNRLTVAWTDPNTVSVYRDLDVNVVGPAGMYINMGARDGASFKNGARLVGVLNNSTTGSFFIDTLRAGTLTTAVSVLGNGNVGIGTDNPTQLLHLYKSSGAISISLQSGNNYGYFFNDSTNVGLGSNIGVTGLKLLVDRNAPDNAFIINSSGNVGIGTTSPDTKLQVNGAITTRLTSGAAAFGNGINIITAPGTYTAGHGGILQFQNEDVITAGIRGTRDPGSWASSMLFYTHTSGTGNTFNTTFTEKMRITDTGNVGIGTTLPGYKLHVDGDSSGYSAGFDNSIIIGENSSTPSNVRFANLTGVYNTFQEGSRIFQYFPDGNGTAEASIYFNRDAGTGGGVTSGACLTFHTTKNTYGPYGAETNYERMRITGRGRVLIGTTNENPAENNLVGVSFFEDGRMFISSDNNEVIRINRKTSDGVLIYFHQDGVAEGNISVSGNTVSYNGFAGCHESSGIDTSVEIGTVVSTIDELDTRIVNQTSQEIKDHAKVKVSDIVGDNRVYGVVQRYNEEGKPMIASVGIGSVLVVGSCSGGDLLESNGDGTARVQNDDIIRSKTIGKVTVGDSRTEVKLVSIVLYCG